MTEGSNDSPTVRGPADFRTFYEREYPKVKGLAYALTGDRSVAEDLAQDAFADAYRSWAEVSAMEHPGAWVRRVVTNRSVSRFRRLGAESRALIRLARPDSEAPSASADSVAVWGAIRKLPRRQVEVVVLSFFEDLSDADVAGVMGCAVNTARTHLKRAKARLGELLGESE